MQIEVEYYFPPAFWHTVDKLVLYSNAFVIAFQNNSVVGAHSCWHVVVPLSRVIVELNTNRLHGDHDNKRYSANVEKNMHAS